MLKSILKVKDALVKVEWVEREELSIINTAKSNVTKNSQQHRRYSTYTVFTSKCYQGLNSEIQFYNLLKGSSKHTESKSSICQCHCAQTILSLPMKAREHGFTGVGLSVCLCQSVTMITKKIMDRFVPNFVERLLGGKEVQVYVSLRSAEGCGSNSQKTL